MARSRSILMPATLDVQVRAIAERAGVRISDQIVQWIVEGVARDGRAEDAPRDDGSRRRRAGAGVGGRRAQRGRRGEPMQDRSRYFERPIVIHRWLTELTGSLTAGAMLSQALYWSHRTADQDGWFYKTQWDWYVEIGFTRTEQEGARKRLRSLGFWHEARRGVPAKLYFQVDREALMIQLDAMPSPTWLQEDQQNSGPLQNAENLHTRVQEIHTLDRAKPANKSDDFAHSGINECACVGILDPEITPEITPETTAESRERRARDSPRPRLQHLTRQHPRAKPRSPAAR